MQTIALRRDSRPRQAGLVAIGTTAVLAAPHLGVPMLLYPLCGIALCRAMLRWQRLDFATLGFRWRARKSLPLLLGGLLGAMYAALNYRVIGPLLAHLLDAYPDLSDFDFVRHNVGGYLLALVLAWVIGGFYEELVFRGFLQTMLLRHLPQRRIRPLIAAVVTALLFALYHLQLGVFGVANALVFALIAAALRQRWPDNLWYLIGFHACADMSAFTLIRFGYL